MIKIGVIDHYLDQYHFLSYPKLIKEASGGEMEIVCAWAETEHEKGKTNAQCCAEQGIELLSSPEEVIEKSDCLIVMSPDNPERHEELCRLPLASGKRTYIDKTFSPDRATAARIIEMGKQGNTPFFSTSSLRYAEEYADIDRSKIQFIASRGPGEFSNYAIHQIEPLVCLMGVNIGKIMYLGTENTVTFIFSYRDGRVATMSQLLGECDFGMAISFADGSAKVIEGATDYGMRFINDLVGFFKDGIVRVPPEETLQVMTVLEYGKQAMENPGVWVELPENKTR